MQYYFISEFPAVIKVNGIYNGKIDCAIKKFNGLSDAYVEVCPLNRTEQPINFMLDGDFLTNPPNGTIVTDLKGAYVISFNCQSSFAPFSIIAQQKFPFAVVTVFKENGLKLSIETPSDFFTQTFYMPECDAKIFAFVLGDKQFVGVHFLGKNNLLVCFLLDSNITKVFSKPTISFSIENGLKTFHEFLDIAKHKVTAEWDFEGSLKAKNTIIERDENYNVQSLENHLIPYAFLEEFMLGGNVDEFLSDDLKENARHLKGFFGEYIGVFPPPEFRSLNEVGLIYCQNENKYYAEYFTFDLIEKKIYGIKKV